MVLFRAPTPVKLSVGSNGMYWTQITDAGAADLVFGKAMGHLEFSEIIKVKLKTKTH